jgi:hypothetical protein
MVATETQRLVAGMLALVFMTAVGVGAQRPPGGLDDPVGGRIRAHEPRIIAQIQSATTRSVTFRNLVASIAATDGIVYVLKGRCLRGARSCIVLDVTKAGRYRILRVLVDSGNDEEVEIGAIGHELYHALEVLSNSTLRSAAALYFFYRREGFGQEFQGMFETYAAVEAGEKIRDEIRQSGRSPRTN